METKVFTVTQENIRLDEVVFKEYGSLDSFEKILELNVSLFMEHKWRGSSWDKRQWLKKGCSVHLPLGAKVLLPIFKVCRRTTEVEASKLW